MAKNSNDMSPKDVLDAVPGLTRDKLNYWALKQYVDVKIEKKGTRKYNHFRPEDLPTIKKAYAYVMINKMKDSEAFEKIYEGLKEK